MEIVGALIAGAFIGSVLGFVGAGGAMLSVPILIYLFDFQPHQATTAALAVVFLAATSAALPKMRKSQILYRDAFIIWGIGSITNVALSTLASHLSDSFITTGFSLVLIFAGLSMLRNPITMIHKRIPVGILILISLVIGAMTGLFGIGGGFLAIPVLVLFFGAPQSVAAGTSLVIIALNSLTAFIAHHSQWHLVQWHIPIFIGFAAVIVAQGASHVSDRTHPARLRKGFALLLFSVALYTLARTWFF